MWVDLECLGIWPCAPTFVRFLVCSSEDASQANRGCVCRCSSHCWHTASYIHRYNTKNIIVSSRPLWMQSVVSAASCAANANGFQNIVWKENSDHNRIWEMRVAARYQSTSHSMDAWLTCYLRVSPYQIGPCIYPIQKLYSVEAAEMDDVLTDKQDCVSCIADFFGNKRGSHNCHMRSVLRDILMANDGACVDVSLEEFSNAFKTISRQTRTNWHGLIVKAYELLFIAQPNALLEWLTKILDSAQCMFSCTPLVSAFGTESNHIGAGDVHVIEVETAFLQVVDALLVIKFEVFFATHFTFSTMIWKVHASTHSRWTSHRLSRCWTNNL